MVIPRNPLLLIDGYNIIGNWTSLKRTRDRHGLESARQQLVEALVNYVAHSGYQAQVVFDSQYRKTPSSLENIPPIYLYTLPLGRKQLIHTLKKSVRLFSSNQSHSASINRRYFRSRSTFDSNRIWRRMDVGSTSS